MNKQQITNLLGAGTVTGLMVAAALFFGGGLGSQPDTVAANANPPIVIAAEGIATDSVTAENAQLREAVQLLQGREGEYRAQIEQANILLAENAAQAQGYEGEAYEYEDEDDYEDDDEYEDDDHEEGDEDEYDADEEDHEEDENEAYAEHDIGEYDSEEEDDDEDEEGDDD